MSGQNFNNKNDNNKKKVVGQPQLNRRLNRRVRRPPKRVILHIPLGNMRGDLGPSEVASSGRVVDPRTARYLAAVLSGLAAFFQIRGRQIVKRGQRVRRAKRG